MKQLCECGQLSEEVPGEEYSRSCGLNRDGRPYLKMTKSGFKSVTVWAVDWNGGSGYPFDSEDIDAGWWIDEDLGTCCADVIHVKGWLIQDLTPVPGKPISQPSLRLTGKTVLVRRIEQNDKLT